MNDTRSIGRNTALATITPAEWPMVLQQAKMLCSTGFLPKAVDTPEKALAIMMKGRELNIPAMYALSNIAVIQGKPSANAELMLALIYRDHGDDAIEFTETSAQRCTIRYKRRTARAHREFTFTSDDARTAGLSSDNWRKYPAAMLRARCVSAVARLAFTDTIAGMYTPEELGAEVEVDTETGEIVLLQSPEPPTIQTVAVPAEKPPPWVTFSDRVVDYLAGIGVGPDEQDDVLDSIDAHLSASGKRNDTTALQAMWKRVKTLNDQQGALALADALRPAVVPVEVAGLGQGMYEPED